MNKATKIAMIKKGSNQNRSNNQGQYNNQDRYREAESRYREHPSREHHMSEQPYREQDRGTNYREGYHKSEQKPPYYYRDRRDKGLRDYEDLDMDTADDWVRSMKTSDHTRSPHWNKEQIKQLIDQREEFRDCNPTELYAVMNMLYADYCEVAKKFGINHVDFFAHLAKAWMNDEDAPKDKTARYYWCVVKGDSEM